MLKPKMPINPLVEWRERGGLWGIRYNFHEGQKAAWQSKKRIVILLAGSRSGKTSFGPHWLYREIRHRGPGDYLVAAPEYPLIDKAAGPEIEHVFGSFFNLGTMKHNPWEFRVSKEGESRLWETKPDRPTRIIFGHADAPDSLEAMTAKAAWLDEAGQKKFKSGSWEAIQRRLSIDEGRVLITSTPYVFNWLKLLLYDKWRAARKQHPEIDIFQFASTMNPAFPPAEMERAIRDLPKWRVDMMFRGMFTKPAGIIYECFDDPPGRHLIPRFPIPETWPRYVGLDFGGVNTAAVFLAKDPETGKMFVYREYHAGNRSAAEHCYHIQKGEPPFSRVAGGAASEGQWRQEFAKGGKTGFGEVPGITVHAPNIRAVGGIQSVVEVGINRVIAAFQRDELFVFDDLPELAEELATYSRVLDDNFEVTETIDQKEIFHLLDSLRYVVGHLKSGLVPEIYVADMEALDRQAARDAEATRRQSRGKPDPADSSPEVQQHRLPGYVPTAEDAERLAALEELMQRDPFERFSAGEDMGRDWWQ